MRSFFFVKCHTVKIRIGPSSASLLLPAGAATSPTPLLYRSRGYSSQARHNPARTLTGTYWVHQNPGNPRRSDRPSPPAYATGLLSSGKQPAVVPVSAELHAGTHPSSQHPQHTLPAFQSALHTSRP